MESAIEGECELNSRSDTNSQRVDCDQPPAPAQHPRELHPSSRWLRRPLVSRLVNEGWTVEVARRETQRLKILGY